MLEEYLLTTTKYPVTHVIADIITFSIKYYITCYIWYVISITLYEETLKCHTHFYHTSFYKKTQETLQKGAGIWQRTSPRTWCGTVTASMAQAWVHDSMNTVLAQEKLHSPSAHKTITKGVNEAVLNTMQYMSSRIYNDLFCSNVKILNS